MAKDKTTEASASMKKRDDKNQKKQKDKEEKIKKQHQQQQAASVANKNNNGSHNDRDSIGSSSSSTLSESNTPDLQISRPSTTPASPMYNRQAGGAVVDDDTDLPMSSDEINSEYERILDDMGVSHAVKEMELSKAARVKYQIIMNFKKKEEQSLVRVTAVWRWAVWRCGGDRFSLRREEESKFVLLFFVLQVPLLLSICISRRCIAFSLFYSLAYLLVP